MMALVPIFVIAVLDGDLRGALWIFAAAGVTDALDGFIARFWKQQTVLGAYLDPAADKLLLVSSYVVLAIPNLHEGYVLPVWVSALVIARDVVIVVVAVILHVASGVSRFPPSLLSKVNTGAQVAAVHLRQPFQGQGPQPEVEGQRPVAEVGVELAVGVEEGFLHDIGGIDAGGQAAVHA